METALDSRWAGLAHIGSGSTLAQEPGEPQTWCRHEGTEEVTSHTSSSWCKLGIYSIKRYLCRSVTSIIHGGLCSCLDAVYRRGMVHPYIKSITIIIIIIQQGFCCCLLSLWSSSDGSKTCCYCYTGTLVSGDIKLAQSTRDSQMTISSETELRWLSALHINPLLPNTAAVSIFLQEAPARPLPHPSSPAIPPIQQVFYLPFSCRWSCVPSWAVSFFILPTCLSSSLSLLLYQCFLVIRMNWICPL